MEFQQNPTGLRRRRFLGWKNRSKPHDSSSTSNRNGAAKHPSSNRNHIAQLFERSTTAKKQTSHYSMTLARESGAAAATSPTSAAATTTTHGLTSSELYERRSSCDHQQQQHHRHDYHRNSHGHGHGHVHGVLLDQDMVLGGESSVSSLLSYGSDQEHEEQDDTSPTPAAAASSSGSFQKKNVMNNEAEAEDDGDCSASSSSSSSSSSVSSFEREYKKMKRLEKQLQTQREFLKRRLDRPTSTTSIHTQSIGIGVENNESFFANLRKILFPDWLMFETFHSIPAMVKVFLICAGHVITSEFVQTASRMVYYQTILKTMIEYRVYIALQILVGLVLLRLNGHVFHFVENSDELKLVRSEFRRRLQIRSLDARFLGFTKGTVIGSSINLVAFYMVYTAVNHLYNIDLYPQWFTVVKESYDKLLNETIKIANVSNETTTLAFYTEFDWEWNVNGDTPQWIGEAEYSTCLVLSQYIPSFVKRSIFMMMCNDPFQEWTFLDFAYHVPWFIVTASLLYRMGTNILTIED